MSHATRDETAPAARPGAAARAPRAVRVLLRPVPRGLRPESLLLLATTLFLVGFGLVMVLSASSVDARIDSGNSFDVFLRQGTFALIGVPMMLLAARLPARFWLRVAWPVLVAGCALQLVVLLTPLGVSVNGNRNWLALGSFGVLQPSEIIKVGIVLWLGMFLTRRQARVQEFAHGVVPAVLVTGLAIVLVVLGGDLGTAMILLLIVIGGLFFGGVRLRHLLVVTGGIAAAVAVAAVSRPSRMVRIEAFLNPSTADYDDTQWQTQNGYFALSDGGVFGTGIGQSKEKWSWLPAVDTDFIFAIVGEDLGLIGACTVLALIVVLAVAFLRLVRQSRTLQQRVVTGAVMTWIVAESLINIAVVLGLLPVLGVPLPFISAGGTALISCLVATGIVLSLARRDLELRRAEPASSGAVGGMSDEEN
ncbi:putative lipid II flippase FtsW [Herbiconiux liangxiaofengii]|uniref:putative lipid II flippase FtsW n=1 Tax=Herbiconiux liangxiaofengii TaxID=3342795 RepID=UPI0035BA5D89